MYTRDKTKALSENFSLLTDLRTEDSGKLGCRLQSEDQLLERYEDFVVTGDVLIVG